MNTIARMPTGYGGGPQQARAGPISERTTLCAGNIMTTEVTTVGPDTTIQEVARILSEKHFSAVPVVDDQGAIVGIVTDGDLLHREELGTDTQCAIDPMGADCVKSHGRYARDVMSRDVVTATEQTSLAEIAEMMDARHIKRVPVARAGRLVGIVSRADIVGALAARPEGSHGPLSDDDDVIRYKVVETLLEISNVSALLTTVNVSNGVVRLEGVVQDWNDDARRSSRRAIEKIPGVVAIDDHRSLLNPFCV